MEEPLPVLQRRAPEPADAVGVPLGRRIAATAGVEAVAAHLGRDDSVWIEVPEGTDVVALARQRRPDQILRHHVRLLRGLHPEVAERQALPPRARRRAAAGGGGAGRGGGGAPAAPRGGRVRGAPFGGGGAPAPPRTSRPR